MAAQPTVVIVVDDNSDFLKSVARPLTVHGFAVRTFTSAEALLDNRDVQTATCLLLDIHLGGISGIELQRRLVALGSTCPVIFMTANDDAATRKAAADAGCVAYLSADDFRSTLINGHSQSPSACLKGAMSESGFIIDQPFVGF